jgi:DNA-binding response OmpR family regulator
MKQRILIVEDNPDLAYGLRNNLEIEGYEVEVAADGRAGLEGARSMRPDLVILDLMLPELDGYQVLRRLRGEGYQMPVLILTARGEEIDKVQGFRLGADQYVTKPFGLLELLARIERLLDRRDSGKDGPGGEDHIVKLGDIESSEGV